MSYVYIRHYYQITAMFQVIRDKHDI